MGTASVRNVAAFTGMPQLYADGDGDVAHEFYVEADTGRLERVHQGLRAVELVSQAALSCLRLGSLLACLV